MNGPRAGSPSGRSPALSVRRRGWLVGASLSLALSVGLATRPEARALAVPLGVLALASTGLVIEAIEATRPAPTRPGSHDRTPADGIVGILALPTLEGIRNQVDPRWRRFRPGDPAGGGRDLGSGLPRETPTLLGRVAVFSIFLGADGRAWTDEEIARGHGSLERAGAWLEREAIRHQAPLHIDLAEVYFRFAEDRDEPIELGYAWEGQEMGPLEANAGTKYLAMASRAAAGLGFADIADLQGRLDPLAGSDRSVWLLHLRRAGRSIAIPAFDSNLAGVGLAVCFAREASFPEKLVGPGRVDPTTIAHELLHLFGASDKYGLPLRIYPPRSVSATDIMRLDRVDLRKMRVDPLTASEIGWRGDVGPPQQKTRR